MINLFLGFNKNLTEIISNKFSDYFKGDFIEENDGYSVFLNEKIPEEDLKSITENLFITKLDLTNELRPNFYYKTPYGDLICTEESFPFASVATGCFSQLSDINIEENLIRFKALTESIISNLTIDLTFGECIN